MSRLSRLAASVAVAVFVLPASAGISVTATGHSGFLLSDGKAKILIDATTVPSKQWPFEAPSSKVLAKMQSGTAPFDGLTLVLITHDHADHYAPEATVKLLAANRKTVVVTTAEVRARLKGVAGFDAVADRVLAPDLAWKKKSTVRVAGMTIEIDRLKHSDGKTTLQNDAFVFTLGGRKILFAAASDGHFPDEYRDLGYANRGFDLAFFAASMVLKATDDGRSAALVPERIDQLKTLVGARTTVLMHVTPNLKASVGAVMPQLQKALPGATWFPNTGESRTY